MAVTPATPWRKVREGSYLRAKEEGQSSIILGRRGSDVPVEYADGCAQEAGRCPAGPQGEREPDPHFGARRTELIAGILGVDEKTAESRALGNTSICFIAAASVSPPPRSPPLSKVKLQFKNPFPLSPSL